ncbi:MauE/DoxX family redox-associated membrane protein [Vibrio sp. HN007]|uniref:MauE/DoxX family redox-associated membrane protein n=1 Tax=Vibrio iocasae TaxID=3098914 RepID=UPI0035D43F22
MELRDHIHRAITDTIWLSLIAIFLKGLFQPSHSAILLKDTGLAPFVLAEILAFVLPIALGVSLFLVLTKRARLTVVIVTLVINTLPTGLAVYQGLYLDCGCYLPGTLESQVYNELIPLFVFQLVLIVAVLGLYIFNRLAESQTTFSHAGKHY